MVTIKTFVNPLIIRNPTIQFITEKCPNLGMYFYRTLAGNPHNVSPHANNLLNNLCKATGIVAPSENKKLDTFINNNYALIDTFINGRVLDIKTPHHNVKVMCD